MEQKQRSIGLDVVRTIAVCSVIAVHFSLNSNFYYTPISNWNMWLQEFFRSFFMTCVPLFMMLTGFLNAKKTVSNDYYKGVWKIVEAYVVFTVAAMLFRHFYLNEYFSTYEWIQKIIRFSANEYGWYVEMYLGLFALIPFLNILYQNISSQRDKKILIVTLALMTAQTSVLFGFSVLPAFWLAIYPLTYYFVGSYIREFSPTIDKKLGFSIVVFLLTLSASVSFLMGKSLVFFYFNSPIVMVCAVVLFLSTYQIDFQNTFFRGVFAKISLFSLDIYLCSYLFDKLFYPYFKSNYFVSQEQFYSYFPLLWFLVFGCSFLVAWIRSWLSSS